MAHQCLQCGRSYPDGSPQILKGCTCKGTRFFYTKQPLGEEERERLLKRTDSELSGEPAKDAEEPRPERRVPTKGELPVGKGTEDDPDWVSLGPGNLRSIVEDVVRRAQEKKPTFRVGEAPASKERPSLEEWVRQQQEGVDEEEGPGSPLEEGGAKGPDWPPWPDPRRRAQQERQAAARSDPPKLREIPDDEVKRAPDEAPDEALEEPPKEGDPVVYRRRTPPPPLALDPQDPQEDDASSPMQEDSASQEDRLPEGVAGSGEDLEPSESREKPETVEVVEQGVYDLDVERLLDKNPIVVHKDGRYSLHLPSLMESLGKKKR